MLNDDLREENLKLRAENKLLRAALEKIRNLDPNDYDFDWVVMAGIMAGTAGAALRCLLPGTHHDAAGGKL